MIDIVYAAPIFDPNKSYDLTTIIQVAVSLVVLVSGLLSVAFVIWWGVMLILSGGKDEKVKPAINSIRYAVLGIILIIIAIFVAPKVGNLLGLKIESYLSPKIIFTTIQELSGKIFGTNGDMNGLQIDSTSSDTLPDGFEDLK